MLMHRTDLSVRSGEEAEPLLLQQWNSQSFAVSIFVILTIWCRAHRAQAIEALRKERLMADEMARREQAAILEAKAIVCPSLQKD